MLLVLEILLIVLAWKRGWKWWAFLPLVIILGTAIITGMDAAFTGIEATLLLGTESLPVIFKIIVNVIFVATMIVLIIWPRRKIKTP